MSINVNEVKSKITSLLLMGQTCAESGTLDDTTAANIFELVLEMLDGLDAAAPKGGAAV